MCVGGGRGEGGSFCCDLSFSLTCEFISFFQCPLLSFREVLGNSRSKCLSSDLPVNRSSSFSLLKSYLAKSARVAFCCLQLKDLTDASIQKEYRYPPNTGILLHSYLPLFKSSHYATSLVQNTYFSTSFQS